MRPAPRVGNLYTRRRRLELWVGGEKGSKFHSPATGSAVFNVPNNNIAVAYLVVYSGGCNSPATIGQSSYLYQPPGTPHTITNQ